MFLFFISRIFWYVCGLAISIACVVHFIPFTYQQVVRARLFPELNEFGWHIPWVSSLALAVLALSHLLDRKLYEMKKGERIFIWLLLVFLPGTFAGASETGLPNGPLSWWAGLATLAVMSAINLLDLRRSLRRFNNLGASCAFRDRDFHLFVSLVATTIVLLIVSNERRGEALVGSFLSLLLIAGGLHGALGLIFRLSELTIAARKTEWILAGALFAVLVFGGLTFGFFPNISYIGSGQLVLAAAFSVSLVTLLMSLSARMRFDANPTLTGLQFLFAPLAFRTSRLWLSTVIIAIISIIYTIVMARITYLDWNFLGQKFVTIVFAALVFAQLLWVLPVKCPSWFRVPYPYVVVAVALALFATQREAIAELNPRANVLFAMARSALVKAEWSGSREFFRFLQQNSNIPKTVQIHPVNIDFASTAELGKLANQKQYNVIMIVIDSLRPDYLSPYNPLVKFTPAIERFAKRSIVFKNAFSRYGATGLSEPSIWAGGMLVHQQYVMPFAPMNALEKLLLAHDYEPFVSMDSILKQILQSGPHLTNLDPGVSTQDLDLCQTLPRLREHLKTRDRERPFFVYTQSQNLHISVLNLKPQEPEQYAGFFAPYAAALSRLDACFGEIFDAEAEKDWMKDTIVIFAADHGDSLGEDGRFGHAYTLFPEIVRVPIIIHLPDDLRKSVAWNESDVAFITDLTPSLYKLLGYEVITSRSFLGRPLFWPKGLTEPQKAAEPYLLASSYGAVYGLLDQAGTDLYIADAINLVDYAYDLRANPPQQRNVSVSERAERARVLQSRILEINDFFGFKSPSP